MSRFDIDQAMQTALGHLQAGRFTDAEKLYQQVLGHKANHADALQFLGLVHAQTGRLDSGVKYVQQAIAIDPSNAAYYCNLGKMLTDHGKLDEAVAACRQALRFKPQFADASNNLGVVLREQGKLDEAVGAYRKALQFRPNFADACCNLGNALMEQGKLDEAIAACLEAVRLKPDYALAYRSLGNALVAKKDFEKAAAAYYQALRLQPRSPDSHNDMGIVLRGQGKLELAVAAFQTAIRLQPNHFEAYNNLGNTLNDLGKADEAMAAYLSAVRLKPDVAVSFLNLGQAYRSAGRHGEALSAFRRALEINADDTDALAKTAVVLAELWQFDEALAAHARLTALAPNAAITYQARGEIFMLQHDVAAAVDQFRRAVDLDPSVEIAWNRLGVALESQGKFDEAEKCFRHILEFCPNAAIGLAYGHLFNIGRISPEQKDIERLSAAIDDPKLSAHNRIGTGFALAKMLEEAGRFDEAFARYAQANSLDSQCQAAAGIRYDPQIARRRVDQMTQMFTPEFFQQRRDWGVRSDLPVFIVGMPRSGTTLVHQIAASHPQVHGAGELIEIGNIAKSLGDLKSANVGWNRDAIKTHSDRHLQHLRSLNGTAQRIIDKMPANVYWVGLICLLYPAARVIFCHREARDTCLSCYFQWFSSSNAYAYDLAHCGHEYLATEDLMAHWRRVLPLAMLDVQYEDLVTDLEGQSRRLIGFLGLPWDPACLEFHRTETTVMTPSAWQVRQPIYKTSVARWRHFERHLGPLLEVLNSRKTSSVS